MNISPCRITKSHNDLLWSCFLVKPSDCNGRVQTLDLLKLCKPDIQMIALRKVVFIKTSGTTDRVMWCYILTCENGHQLQTFGCNSKPINMHEILILKAGIDELSCRGKGTWRIWRKEGPGLKDCDVFQTLNSFVLLPSLHNFECFPSLQ